MPNWRLCKHESSKSMSPTEPAGTHTVALTMATASGAEGAVTRPRHANLYKRARFAKLPCIDASTSIAMLSHPIWAKLALMYSVSEKPDEPTCDHRAGWT